jgi:hypothetical protein
MNADSAENAGNANNAPAAAGPTKQGTRLRF